MKHIVFTAALLLASTSAYAGSGHHHGHSHGGHGHAHHEAKTLGEQEAVTAAKNAIPLLITQGHEINGAPLDGAWKEAAASGKIYQKGKGYFIVSFDGAREQTLYLLLSDVGELYDVNFNGVFEGLKQ